ncbi:nuclear transport factor 2 family protein [Nocardia carnea]|uniref:nuclear transport factor 2 family protein n=1 Tax=Nocardia carnea TaxID=37328 RepID=UPI002454FFC5|nr:nuclear transport factor 2 family protein [Nocardia carnea]
MTTDRRAMHEDIVGAFAAGWADVDSRAIEPFMTPDVELVQPFIPTCHGTGEWWAYVDRLQTFATGLRSEVLHWSGTADRLFIEHRLSATVGRRVVRITAVDSFELTGEGKIFRRVAYFDPSPLVVAVLLSPRVWLRWWRSGLRPRLGSPA